MNKNIIADRTIFYLHSQEKPLLCFCFDIPTASKYKHFSVSHRDYEIAYERVLYEAASKMGYYEQAVCIISDFQT